MRQQLVTALAALSATTFAAPTELKQGFTVNQVDTGKKILKNGPAEIKKTFLKYGKTPPANVINAAAAVQSGTVKASPEAYDSSYLCPVSVGSPAQVLNLDFDTGSSDLWVFSSLLPSSEQTGHSTYTPSNSTTSQSQSGETWDISYGDGSGASGVVYSDKVVIGGVTATSQSVEAATSVSSTFTSNTDNDGLVGLAFDNINTCSPAVCKTFMDNVSPTLPKSLFTSSLKYHAAGSYDFGYIDTNKYTGTIGYTTISTANGFWEFPVTGYQVGSGTAVSVNYDSIADTGTTLLYMHQAVLTAYYAKVSGAMNYSPAGGYIFPCSSTLPSLSIKIGSTYRTIPGTYLNYAPYGSGYCFGGLQSSAGIGFDILGDIFLKSQFVVWNYGGKQIGFASQK